MKNHAKRPRRQNKGDRLLTSGATRDEIAVDHAVAPFDRKARELEMIWGFDRLPELVGPDLAAKYGAAIAYLNEAIQKNDPEQAAAASANCIKGLAALDAAARAAGHVPPGAIAHGEVDGWAFRIVADAGDRVNGAEMPTFSLREVGLALKAYTQSVCMDAISKHFPKAEITDIRPKTNWDHGDEFSFDQEKAT